MIIPLLLCSGCTGHLRNADRFTDSTIPAGGVELGDTVFFSQDRYQCGPAALATILQTSDIAVQPSELVSRIYLPERRGSLQTEIISASRSYGRIAYVIKPDINALIKELQAGYPVLVLQNLGIKLLPVWHYAVVIGYSPESREIILRSGTTRRETTSVKHFLKSWSASDNWGLIVLKPTQLPADLDADRFLKAVADLEETGQVVTSLEAYKTAASQWPDKPTAWFGLGNAQYHNKSFNEAETAYRRAIALKPDHLPALNNLALTLAELKRNAAAQKIISRVLADTDPQSSMYQTLLNTQQEITLKQP